jgi:hypothetical protein
VDLRDFPNSDFYYKLVAKVGGKYYSIYDGKTEYVIGSQMRQPVKSNHEGGFYVYPTLDEAIFADVPFNKGGHYLAPRTVLKCVCWGNFVLYSHGKMAFTNIMAVEDLGLPIGYKNTKESIKQAVRQQETIRYKFKEADYNRRLVMKSLQSDPYERSKFENYFGPKAAKRMEEAVRPETKQKKREVDPNVAIKI